MAHQILASVELTFQHILMEAWGEYYNHTQPMTPKLAKFLGETLMESGAETTKRHLLLAHHSQDDVTKCYVTCEDCNFTNGKVTEEKSE
tara:strand:+ start:547 stop:813 length:267 start_codon:yes stop_codon:yes gene_type:complete